jgi:hypothetical protein
VWIKRRYGSPDDRRVFFVLIPHTYRRYAPSGVPLWLLNREAIFYCAESEVIGEKGRMAAASPPRRNMERTGVCEKEGVWK